MRWTLMMALIMLSSKQVSTNNSDRSTFTHHPTLFLVKTPFCGGILICILQLLITQVNSAATAFSLPCHTRRPFSQGHLEPIIIKKKPEESLGVVVAVSPRGMSQERLTSTQHTVSLAPPGHPRDAIPSSTVSFMGWSSEQYVINSSIEQAYVGDARCNQT